MTLSALSLLAPPMAWVADRVDAGYARGREYSGLSLGLKRGLVLARAWSGPPTTSREGSEAQAGVETREGGGTQEGGKPFCSRARCGAPCLAPGWDAEVFETRRCTETLGRFDSWLRIEAGTECGRRTTLHSGEQTKTARGGFDFYSSLTSFRMARPEVPTVP